MKIFLVIAALCLATVSADGMERAKGLIPPKIRAFIEECMFENGLTKDNIKDMIAQKNFHDMGCAIACVHEKMELIDENGNIILEAYENIAKNILQTLGHEYNEDVTKILTDCIDLSTEITERCEKYLVLSQCTAQRYFEYFSHKNANNM